MIGLREALINKRTINKIKKDKIFTNCKKIDLKTGDLIKLKLPYYGVFVKKGDAEWDDFYMGSMFYEPNPNTDNFCFFEGLDDGDPIFTWLWLTDYSSNLESTEDSRWDVEKVVKGALKSDQMTPDDIAYFFEDKERIKKLFGE